MAFKHYCGLPDAMDMSNEFSTVVMQGEMIDAGLPVRREVSVAQIVARMPISIRKATEADLPFIDGLQKKHSRELGFLPTMALVGKIKLGQVVVAEGTMQTAEGRKDMGLAPSPPAAYCPLPAPVGYLIAADRYFKRDEIGYITQINILPEYRRSLVAAELLQYQFEQSAYGCKLYSCWCAQDLKANEFWEAMGFSAIAFRMGADSKGEKVNGKREPRVHIFWQTRIRSGDTTTPWWYPSQTGGGEMRADRICFPIMKGVSWRDVRPIVLEALAPVSIPCDANTGPTPEPQKKAKKVAMKPVQRPAHLRGGLWFKPVAEVEEARPAEEIKPAKAKPAKKIDPRLTAMARELRDQWSEVSKQIVEAVEAKYDVKRIADRKPKANDLTKLLAA